jgi:Ca2+-transporting ATPase
MTRQPRNPRVGVFTRPVVSVLLAGGVWSAAINMGLFLWLLQQGRPLPEVMAMTFVTLVLIQFFHAYNCRSEHLSIARAPFANRWLNLAVTWEVVMLGAILYVPILQQAFGTFGLSLADWGLVLALAASIVPVIEVVKWFTRRM